MQKKLIKGIRRGLPFALSAMRSPLTAKKAYDIWRNPGQISEQDLDELTRNSLAAAWPATVRARIAETLYINGRFDEALELLHKSKGTDPKNMEGWLLLYLGKYRRALEIFSALSDLPKPKPDALKNQAFTRYLMGNLDEAVRTLIIAIALSPSRTPSITLLSRIVRNQREIDELLLEMQRLAKTAITAAGSAQLVRACARAGAKQEGEKVARNALVNMALSRAAGTHVSERKATETGMPEGRFTGERGILVLDHFAQAISGNDARFFLMGGTLLGMVRDNKLLPWDKDLDLGCLAHEATLEDLWEIFTASPYFVPMGTVGDRLLKLRHITGVNVDIFINFVDGEIIWHGGQFVYWRSPIFDLRLVSYGGRQFHIPDSPEAYLENHYGSYWRTPDPAYDVFWESPDIFNINAEHRYLNTIARGIQMLAAGARDTLDSRFERAKRGGAGDVADGYSFVSGIYDEYYRT